MDGRRFPDNLRHVERASRFAASARQSPSSPMGKGWGGGICLAELSALRASPDEAAHGVALHDALRVWLRVALLSFGGPTGLRGARLRRPAGGRAISLATELERRSSCEPLPSF